MADDIDGATLRIEEFNKAALAKTLIRPPATPSTGICTNCDEKIESDRLKHLPNTHHCADCASALEEDRARAKRRGW